MKSILIIANFLFLSFISLAQFPGGGSRGGQNMNMGHIYGKIVDVKSNKPLEAVSVQVLQNKMDTATKTRKDVVIAGQLTKANGNFSIEGLPIGANLKVKISAIGFEPIEQKLQFNIDMNAMKSGDMNAMLNNIDKDLGNIKLNISITKGEDVTVVGTRTTALQLGIDRKVFNVEKNIVSAGGTAVDVMRNVPSVQVDIDGNVTLRNNAPQIFVDGRPTPLSLDQIPSDAIASVELITNPSAKFDASGGTSGIINIVLKKNKKVGYNGNVRASVDSRAKVGGGADINIRQEKVNVFASVNYNQRKSLATGYSNRYNKFDNSNVIQRNDNTSIGAFKFVRAGLDYFLDNRNTISIAGNIMGGGFKPKEIIDIYSSILAPTNTAYKSYRDTRSTNRFDNAGGTLSFKHLFTKPGNELTADVTYNKSKNKNDADFINSPYTSNGEEALYQQVRAKGGRENITIQSDYTQPIGKNAKWEAGVRFNQSKVNSLNNNYIKQPYASDFIYLPEVGYDFNTKENIYAAYSTYSQKLNKTNIQLGLRWESSTYDGDLVSRNQKFSNKYPNSFFPSLFITQSLGKGQDLQLNYTRKINRPNFFQLLPFVDYADSLNISKGNPGLIPEFTNSVELSYQLPYGKNAVLLVSSYYKNTSNLIARYQDKQSIGGRDVIVNSYINANESIVYGLELTNKNNITTWWDIATNVNFYGSKLNIPNFPVISDKLSWFGKLNSNMKLPKNFTIQISGDYQSKSVLPPGGNGGGSTFGGGGGGGMFGGGRGGMGGGQSSTAQGFIRANWGMDLAIRKEFMKDKKASISLNVNDIFRTKVNAIYTDTDLFTQDSWRRRDPQVFRLNFSYRFGKFDASIFKRKNMKGEREGMGAGMEGGM